LKSLIFITVGKRSVACGKAELQLSAWKAEQNSASKYCLSGRELQFRLTTGYASLTYGYENQALRAKTQPFFISNSC